MSWSPHSSNNRCGPILYKFSRDCGFLLSYPSEPTVVPYRTNHRPATLDIGISCGLDNILVQSHAELSSDHNPVQFVVPEANKMPYTQNCTTFTNWSLFQELLTTSVPGNPIINSTSDIDNRIEQLTNHIHCAINQSSKFKVIQHNIIFIPQALRRKISEKNRLRKLWQTTLITLQLNKNSTGYSGR
ncbi:RNA-directed DNA polymerase from mobile element jockey [Trichonephila clavata]|uniref:RNA-directed DNA polymerase from mobile element jockey n=1 Tax=Trichonephila clavata TaxID=2740835 RepID=A0A8X6GYP0_TRICU|nr:RNA-directed DNA polymerase from mobile element jockey [Trichonephila clavata]